MNWPGKSAACRGRQLEQELSHFTEKSRCFKERMTQTFCVISAAHLVKKCLADQGQCCCRRCTRLNH
jgi:hypothetical protein